LEEDGSITIHSECGSNSINVTRKYELQDDQVILVIEFFKIKIT